MSIRIPSHLFRNRHGTFYFRLVIPQDLRNKINQREIRFSLQTEQRQKAVLLASHLIAKLPEHISELRRMTEQSDTPITDGDIPILDNHHLLWLEQLRRNLRIQIENDELTKRVGELELQLGKSTSTERASLFVERAYDKGQLKARREIEEQLVFPWSSERTALFSELQTAYMKSLTVRATGGIKKPPNAKTIEEYAHSIKFFITVMGDLRIGEIDREIAGEYFSTLKKLPANLSRLSKYRGKSIAELIAMGDSPQSEVNISKKIERISTMFKWALEEKRKWGIDANPFTGFGQAEGAATTRRPFTNEELSLLLNHPDYIKRKFKSSYAFWLIPLALFTGARLSELCQLDLKDFVMVDGIACIDVNDIEAVETVSEAGAKNKRIKNKNAKRLVPIHDALIDIGLLRYVESLRQDGHEHLFPELNRNRRDGAGHAPSNWFQRFRKRVGIVSKQVAVFHSFRHYFITNILDNEVSPHMLAPIVGHEADLITGKVYWNTRDANKRKPTVDNFILPDAVFRLIPKVEDVGYPKALNKATIKN